MTPYFCFLLLAASPLEPKTPDENALLVLRVMWEKHTLSEGLIAYGSPSGVLLPLSELCSVLEFPITADLNQGRASGWFLDEDRHFSLDLAGGDVLVDGKPGAFDPSGVVLYEDDIFVETGLLSQWFPVQFHYTASEMKLKVVPEEPLPMARRMERKKKRVLAAWGDGASQSTLPVKSAPYRLLAWPYLQTSLGMNLFRRDSATQTDGRFALRGAGDLAFMSSEFFVSGRTGEEASGVDALRLKMGRKGGTLLGPLKASMWEVGDVTPNFPLELASNSPRLGAMVSNFPIHRPASFDTIQLSGWLEPGWEVELWRNGVLLDYMESGDGSRYGFENVALLYGRNLIRLEFYGPQGQRRSEERVYLIEADLIEPGKTFYSASWQDARYLLDKKPPHEQEGFSKPMGSRLFAQVERGFHRALAVNLNMARLQVEEAWRWYGGLGLRSSFWGSFARADLVRDRDGGWMGNASFHTRKRKVDLKFTHGTFMNFVSETLSGEGDPPRHRSDLNLSGAYGLGGLPLTWALSADRVVRASGVWLTTWGSRLSTNWRGMSFSGVFSYRQGTRVMEKITGSALAGGRLGRYRLRGSLGFRSSLDRVGMEINRNWSGGLRTRLSLTRNFGDTSTYKAIAGAHWTRKRLTLGLNANQAPNTGLEASLNMNLNLSREPRSGSWSAQSRPVLNYGGASALVYLDQDLNGKFDGEDQLLEGVRFSVNRSGTPVRTGKNGVAFFKELPTHQPLDLEIIPSSLPDPYHTPVVAGHGLRVRPGAVQLLEFPIAESGDIEGRVGLRVEDVPQPLSNVKVRLLDRDGQLLRVVKTDYDGFYLFDKLPPGAYGVAVDGDQMAQLNLKIQSGDAKPVREAVIDQGGRILEIHFTLNRRQ